MLYVRPPAQRSYLGKSSTVTVTRLAGNGRLGNLSAHLTNTCHLSHSGSSAWKEDDVVKLASELPQVECQPLP